jgi:hypothetical protein
MAIGRLCAEPRVRCLRAARLYSIEYRQLATTLQRSSGGGALSPLEAHCAILHANHAANSILNHPTSQPRLQLHKRLIAMANQILEAHTSAHTSRTSLPMPLLSKTHLLTLLQLSICLPVHLKYWIPAKFRRTPRRDDPPLRTPLEQDRLLAWAGAERKSTDCDGRFVLVGGEEVVEASVSQGGQEMFAAVEERSG